MADFLLILAAVTVAGVTGFITGLDYAESRAVARATRPADTDEETRSV